MRIQILTYRRFPGDLCCSYGILAATLLLLLLADRQFPKKIYIAESLRGG